MTREEEIREAAEIYSAYIDATDEEDLYNTVELEAFMDGAEWADKHPAKKQTETIDAWVARDDDETIRLWDGCPYKSHLKVWFCICSQSIKLPLESFPEVTWENSPKKVKVTIELEEEQ